MQTIIQIDSALVWTGATADIDDHDGIPYGWVAVPAAPTLVEGALRANTEAAFTMLFLWPRVLLRTFTGI